MSDQDKDLEAKHVLVEDPRDPLLQRKVIMQFKDLSEEDQRKIIGKRVHQKKYGSRSRLVDLAGKAIEEMQSK